MWYDRYKNELVGFVAQYPNGYAPVIGRCIESDGDDDCVIGIEFRHAKVKTLDEALAILDAEADKVVRVFRTPDTPSIMGHWLTVLVKNDDGTIPATVTETV